MTVANVGVPVADMLLQPRKRQTESLLWKGDATEFDGSLEDPGFLHDVFMRSDGPAEVAKTAGHVIGDNLWLWRADHVEGEAL